eukprot:CAMPEP_0185436730 /NCGR_PEP_ID=MMETSP1365-20130426/28908_1 /TAXON_ID=38817 /ORGANISM="Gephyrocapsa oceanica, Strain RCC1303" /LENGTH=46 /DNA_ID= /DNA_START= /DNA_END= /DNA_ORIENTATION=
MCHVLSMHTHHSVEVSRAICEIARDRRAVGDLRTAVSVLMTPPSNN